MTSTPDVIVVAKEASKHAVRWRKFCLFMYNKSEGTIMGRTGTEWIKVIAFYVTFYGLLAAFFSIALHLFLSTLDDRQPKWLGEEGIIGSSPGRVHCSVRTEVFVIFYMGWLPVYIVRNGNNSALRLQVIFKANQISILIAFLNALLQSSNDEDASTALRAIYKICGIRVKSVSFHLVLSFLELFSSEVITYWYAD